MNISMIQHFIISSHLHDEAWHGGKVFIMHADYFINNIHLFQTIEITNTTIFGTGSIKEREQSISFSDSIEFNINSISEIANYI
jgi:hypothetical protein